MTEIFLETLKRRGNRYRLLSFWAVGLALTCGLIAYSSWMPSAASNQAFFRIHIPWIACEFWNVAVGPVQQPQGDAHNTLGLIGPVFNLATLFSIPVLFLFKRRRLALAVAGLWLLMGAAHQAYETRHPFSYVLPASISAKTYTALEKLASEKPLVHLSGKASSTTDKGSISVEPLTAFAPYNGKSQPNQITDPVIYPILHYVLAQKAYLANNPDDVARHIRAIDRDIPPGRTVLRRIDLMREWAAMKGYEVTPRDYDSPFAPAFILRPLAELCLALAVLLTLAATTSAVIANIIRRRLNRLQSIISTMLDTNRWPIEDGRTPPSNHAAASRLCRGGDVRLILWICAGRT